MTNSNEGITKKDKLIGLVKKIGIGAAILIVVFLVGYVPGYLDASSAKQQNVQLENRLNLTGLLNKLGMASFEVNRNNYANAAQYSTEFFNGLRETTNGTADNGLKQKLQSILDRRDEITGKLAEGNPSVKETLAQMYSDVFGLIKDQQSKTQSN
jgi:hypothetical protein